MDLFSWLCYQRFIHFGKVLSWTHHAAVLLGVRCEIPDAWACSCVFMRRRIVGQSSAKEAARQCVGDAEKIVRNMSRMKLTHNEKPQIFFGAFLFHVEASKVPRKTCRDSAMVIGVFHGHPQPPLGGTEKSQAVRGGISRSTAVLRWIRAHPANGWRNRSYSRDAGLGAVQSLRVC